MKTSAKKPTAILLATVLAVPLFAALAPAVSFAAEGDGFFTDFGFNNKAVPGGYSSSRTPYGKNNFVFKTVSELFVGVDDPAQVRNDAIPRAYNLYGHESAMAFTGPAQYSPTPGQKYDAYATAPGLFTYQGTSQPNKKMIVALGANTIRDSVSSADRPEAGLFMFFIDPLTGEQTNPSDVIELYKGPIGNSYELDGGYLRYDAVKDRDDGASNTFGFYDSALLHNYMQVVTGDFNGDGFDEVAVYVPDPNQPRVEVYRYAGASTAWLNPAGWGLIATHNVSLGSAGNVMPNKVSMVVGDINFDGIDDLALAFANGNFTNVGDQYGTFAYSLSVYLGSRGTGSLFTVTNLAAAQSVLGVPSLVFGDFDASGQKCLMAVRAYYQHTGNRFVKSTIYMSRYHFNPDTNTFTEEALKFADKTQVIERDQVYPHVRADAVAVSSGPGFADKLYYHGLIWEIRNGVMDRGVLQVYDSATSPIVAEMRNNGTNAYFEYGIVATDLDNDFLDEIVLSYTRVRLNNDGPDILPTRGLVLKQEPFFSACSDEDYCWQWAVPVRSLNNDPANPTRHHRSSLLMATPDTDNDSVALRYKSQEVVYSDPKILAVLAGAPLHADLANSPGSEHYFDTSETGWGTYKGTGGSSTQSGSFSAGVYFGYEHESTVFGAPLFSIEMEFEYKHTTTWTTQKDSSITHTIEYKTKGYEDSVVLYSVPTAVYTYDMTYPNPADPYGATETQEFQLSLPYTPSVVVMTVDEYDAIVAKYASHADYKDVLPPIRDSGILTHTQGDPFTYLTESQARGRYESGNDLLIYNGTWSGVYYGNSGFISQSIEVSKTETKSTMHQESFSFKVGIGAGGFKAGVTLGAEYGHGSAKISTTGSIFSGTVANMPNDARNLDYGYSWKLMHYRWKSTDGKMAVPVVSYVIQPDSSRRPLAIPTNLAIDLPSTTSSSLKLTWNYPPGITSMGWFEIYRADERNDFELVGTANYIPTTGSYAFTDTGLGPDTRYYYKVKACRTSQAPLESLFSKQVSGFTTGVNLTLTYRATPAAGGYVQAQYGIGGALPSGSPAIRGRSITMTAIPAAGYRFEHWLVYPAANPAAAIEEAGTTGQTGVNTRNFNMPDTATEIEAVFTLIPPDTDPPTIEWLTPAGTGAMRQGFVYIAFDKPMDQTVHGTVTFDAGPIATGTETSGSLAPRWEDESTYRIYYQGMSNTTPPSGIELPFGTAVQVNVSGFADLAGNVMAPDNAHGFTVVEASQKWTIGNNKAATAADVPIRGVASQTEMNGFIGNFAGTVSDITLVRLNNLNNVPGLNFQPIHDTSGSDRFYYYVTTTPATPGGRHILSMDVEDADGETVTSNVFYVTVVDKTPPVLETVLPTGNDTAASGEIVLVFDKVMGVAGEVSLDNGVGPLAGGGWASAGVYSVPYAGLAPNTTHTITVSGFADLFGNVMTADSTHTFTTASTADTAPPVVLTVAPSGMAFTDDAILITFNKDMDPAATGTVALDQGIGLLDASEGQWIASTAYVIGYSGLAPGQTYTITIDGFADLAGNLMAAADAAHSFSTIGTPVQNPASLDETRLSFDKNPASSAYADVSVRLFTSGYDLDSILYDLSELTEGVEYTVSGDHYTFKKEYLATLDLGERRFAFVMSGGGNPELTVTVLDTTPQVVRDAALDKATAVFDINPASSDHQDITVKLDPGDFDYQAMLLGEDLVNTGSTHVITGNNYAFTKSYLASLATGEHDFTFLMSGGVNPTFRLTVVDTSDPSISPASLNPATAYFEKNPVFPAYADVPVVLDAGGYALVAIKYGLDELVEGRDYSVSGSTYTFFKEYLASLADQDESLVFAMSGGTNPVLTIYISNSPSDGYPLTVNGGTGGGSYHAGTAVVITAAPPAPGKVFKQWTGGDGGTFDDPTSATANFIMPPRPATVTANYEDAEPGDVLVTAITINGAAPITTKGGTVQLTATVSPADATNQNLTWSVVSGGAFATVSSTGLVTATGNGTAVVRATAQDGSAVFSEATIVVTGQIVGYTLTVTGGSGGGEYLAGTEVTITAGTPALGKVFKEWTGGNGGDFLDPTSATTTFTMPANDATVTATYEDAQPQVVLVTGITINGVAPITTKGGTVQLTAAITPNDATNQAVTWSVVSGGAFATVSPTGLVTAIGNGTVVVRATAQDGSAVYAEATISVIGQSTVYSLTVNGGSGGGSFDAGTTVVITASPPALGKVFKEWTGGNGGVFGDPTSSSTTFTMPAGDATVTATYEDASPQVVLVTGITINGAAAITANGGTVKLTAAVTPTDATNQNVTWSVVSGGGFATVSSTGLVTATANGVAVVRATAQDGSAVYGEVTIAITGQSDDGLVPTPGKFAVLEHFGTWKDKVGSASAKVDADHLKFLRLEKDGKVVDRSNYSVTPGSTVITFAQSYLQTLPAGTHWYVAVFSHGQSYPIKLVVPASGGGGGSGGQSQAGLAFTGTDTVWSTTILAELLVLFGGLLVAFGRRRLGGRR
ncbi:MAG: Ig-like domain-containing protein [Micrococcales bacterium]|nr:Ig-like domain-containing protein [Micrococcales bacterium]